MQRDPDGIPYIWELYGVKENPFDTSPLLVMGGTLPIESFVGREEEVKRMNKIIGSKGGSRAVVYGDVGVGKTTFVNVVRHNALKNGFFTPFKEIALQEDWDPLTVLLNTLSAIYGTLKVMKERPINDELYKKLEDLFEMGAHNVNFGFSIAGFGGNYGSEKSHPLQITISMLKDFLTEVITDIINETNNEVIIHYNNLELLSEKKLRSTFNNLRDFFQTRGIHFIFVGNLTVQSNIQSIPRFSSILTDTPFHIENLTFEEVDEIIRNRFEALKIEDLNYVLPYTQDALESLYKLMDGNIRNILNSLSTAVLERTGERPISLDKNVLSKTLHYVLEQRYLKDITQRQKDVLFEIVKHQEITNKGLADNLSIQRSNISIYIRDLVSAGCVYLRRKNGKDKYWSAEPKIKWYLLKESTQQTIYSYLSP